MEIISLNPNQTITQTFQIKLTPKQKTNQDKRKRSENRDALGDKQVRIPSDGSDSHGQTTA